MLRITEIFGPTIQGEGSAAGQHCLFVRLAGCNLECSWCDTPYTWAWTDEKAAIHSAGKKYDKYDNLTYMTTDAVLVVLKSLWDIESDPTLIVISGGEPLVQSTVLGSLIKTLVGYGCSVHIETAGTISPDWNTRTYTTQFNISPKLYNSGNRIGKRYKPQVLSDFAKLRHAWFKFVVQGKEDFKEIDEIVAACSIRRDRIQIMPEGTSATNVMYGASTLADEAIKRGWGVSLRSHVLIWGDERGR